MKCSKCETVPSPYPENCALYLSPPEAATEAVLRRCLKEAGLAPEDADGGVLRVRPIRRDQLLALCNGPLENLNRLQQDDTRCLVTEADTNPGLRELMHMETLGTVMGRVKSADLALLLQENRLTNFFQPIVHCGNPGEVFGYECLIRGVSPEGDLIFPDVLFEQARRAGMLFQLDRAARIAAIHNAARHGITQRVFINFNPTSIYNPEFCLRTTVQAMEESHLQSDQIVFEVVESDEMNDVEHLIRIVTYYRERGFTAALDDLGAGYSSLNLLHRLKPDLIKLDMALIRDVDTEPFKASIVRNLLDLARSLGVKTVVEGVETVGEWQWLLAHGANYAQGYLFGKPQETPQEPIVPSVA